MTGRWKRRPHGSTWGDFGPDDQFGRMNLVTPAKVREGVAGSLALPLDSRGANVLTPRRHPPLLRPTLRGNKANFNYALAADDPDRTDVVNDDLTIMHLQYSTQWDSFAHVGSLFDADGDGKPEPVFYNGYRAGEHIVGPTDAEDAVPQGETSTSAAHALGGENMAVRCLE